MGLICLRQKPRSAGLGFKLTMWAARNEWTVQDKAMWDTRRTRAAIMKAAFRKQPSWRVTLVKP